MRRRLHKSRFGQKQKQGAIIAMRGVVPPSPTVFNDPPSRPDSRRDKLVTVST